MPVLLMYFIYSLLLGLGFLILLPRFLFDAFRHGKYVAGFRERLGLVNSLNTNGRPLIRIHCVSVGETQAARPLIQGLKKRFPDHSIAISTTTLTGQNIAREVFKGQVEKVFYFPFDWRWIIRKTLYAVNPSLVLIMETELWPNFLRECQARGLPVAIVNGRLSEQSFRRYKIISGFMSRVLGALSLAAVQTESDAKRLRALGLDAAKIFVTGSTKFDAVAEPSTDKLTSDFRERFKLDLGAPPLILAASTHAPEERILINALRQVISGSQLKSRLMIAPRHPERFREVAALIQGSGFQSTKRTAAPSPSDGLCEVILLDSIGELTAIYSLASIVFVGGSIANTGGHNILEPAAAGVPVVTGPHTLNFKQIVETFIDAEAVIQLPLLPEAETTVELSRILKQLLADPEKRTELGRRARRLVNQNRGATERTLELLGSILIK